MHNHNSGKNSSKKWTTSVIFKKLPKVNNGRKIRGKFGLSGHPGANPTIVSYNAIVVKIYNATSSLARFEQIKIFISFGKTL
jgi:hypothetical protein